MIDYSKILNSAVTEIKPSGIRKFFDIAATMDNVISLGVGEPDFQTPWQIRKEGINSLQSGKTKYTSNSGLNELREEISRYMKRKYSVEYWKIKNWTHHRRKLQNDVSNFFICDFGQNEDFDDS